MEIVYLFKEKNMFLVTTKRRPRFYTGVVIDQLKNANKIAQDLRRLKSSWGRVVAISAAVVGLIALCGGVVTLPRPLGLNFLREDGVQPLFAKIKGASAACKFSFAIAGASLVPLYLGVVQHQKKWTQVKDEIAQKEQQRAQSLIAAQREFEQKMKAIWEHLQFKYGEDDYMLFMWKKSGRSLFLQDLQREKHTDKMLWSWIESLEFLKEPLIKTVRS